MPPVWVLPILHPARILRGGYPLEPAQREALLRVRETLADLDAGQPPRHWVDTNQSPPDSIGAPTLADLAEWRATADLTQGVAIDLECAGRYLRGVGFCALADLRPLWLPFRRQGGGPYWPNVTELTAAVEWCQALLVDPTIIKWWHNGINFDVGYLEEQGFTVVGPHRDTILLAHTHMPEMPKSLQWLSTYHLGMPSWKQLSETDEEMEK